MEDKRCNICGKKFNIYDATGGANVNKVMGYGSKYDMYRVNINICCDCMDDLIDSCKISPVVCKDHAQVLEGIDT